MAVVLACAAIVMCLVNLLSEESLTALTSHAANKLLDAKVKIGRVDLSMSGRVPLLKLEIDSVTVLSGPMLRLSEQQRAFLPEWGDTLLTLKHFEGGLNVAALLRGKIDIHDVKFDEPGVNILSVNDSISNYLIYTSRSTEEADTSAMSMPKIGINRFSITNPKPLRFHNAATGEHFAVILKTLSIDGGNQPTYALDLGGNMAMPSLAVYNLGDLRFGANGSLSWNPEMPTELELEDFTLFANSFNSSVSAHVDFANDIIVKDYAIGLEKTMIEDLVALVPDSLRKAYGLQPEKFSTDCAIDFALKSAAPFNLSTDTVPNAEIVINLSPGAMRYDKAVFRNVSGQIKAVLRGNDLNQAEFEACDFNIAGPATDLTINAKATQVMDDALVTGSVKGATDIARLPSKLRELAKGYMKGRLTADLKFEARPSMFTRNNFHKLNLRGDLNVYDLYYLSSDTANMFDVSHASFEFGTKEKIKSNSMLMAKIKVDSADILHTQYSMKMSDVSLGVGVRNTASVADTTIVVPMGGDLKLGKFYLTVLGDSIAFYMRNGHGRVTMKRYNDEARRPLFGLNLDVERISTGSPQARFMISQATINASAYKLDRPRMPKIVEKTADSIKAVYPDMPVDSVYARAIRLVREKRKSPYPRVHPQYTDSAEIIYWGTSTFLRDLLLGWKIDGNIKANRAGLYTPYFPVRNRVRDFNISFCNDSIVLTNVRYKLGASDFLLSGKISNIRRGFTSKGYLSPLKINMELLSDTIDVNELASATFRGSSYAARRESEGLDRFSLDSLERSEQESDEAFEREMGKIVANAPDSMAPLLIPKNITASLNVNARNILYSDLLFHDFSGELLASRGSLNLHDLKASSAMGNVNLSALYSSQSVNDIKFGFGMQVDRFNIERFIKLVPAIDSIMPLMRDFGGIINADIAATCDVDKGMNLVLPSLEAAIKISGDSLEIIDPDTYRNIGKWLMFKDKQDNIIKHMNVELIVKDNMMQLYPFIFDLDRYKLGVEGHNDLNLNFDYHIAVLKSPLPFKFGVNIKGNPDKYKVRLGKARLNERQVAQSVTIVDTTRVNLLSQLENVFRRGVSNSRFARLNMAPVPTASQIDLNADTISHADSLVFIKEGLIPAPVTPPADDSSDVKKDTGRKNSKKKKQKDNKQTKETAYLKENGPKD